jgi:hypothetical protein
MSGVADSGREIGHGNIDANDPKRAWVDYGSGNGCFVIRFLMVRTIVAFALAPLWATAATIVWACYAFPYPEQRHWIAIATFVGTIFAYAGTFAIGIPAYRILSARNQVSAWTAVVLGFGIGSITWIVFEVLFVFSLGAGAAFSWWQLTLDLTEWHFLLPVGALGSLVGLTLWLIARPDRQSMWSQH